MITCFTAWKICSSASNGERRRMLGEQEAALRAKLGRAPSEAELAQALGMDPAELASLRAQCEPLRFEALDEAYSDGDPAFADPMPDALAMLQDQELRGQVTQAVAALPERLQLVIQLYFVEELNLAEIAGVLEVSIPRVHQLKAQALDRLRAALEGVAELI
jgi:RNA polymerase sigma factor for flagellar operon FliA